MPPQLLRLRLDARLRRRLLLRRPRSRPTPPLLLSLSLLSLGLLSMGLP